MDDRWISYERDGSVTLSQSERRRTIPPGWTDAEVDAAAADFFADEG